MLLGILSDIHSNFEALTAVYDELTKEGCTKVICAGDVVGYGANPKECIDFVNDKGIESVRGNHDTYVTQEEKEWLIQPYAKDAIVWTKDMLDDEHKSWLTQLPLELTWEGLTFVHASLECLDGEYWPYILDTKSAMFHFFSQTTKYAFFGHTHIPLLFTYDETHRISIEILRNKTIDDDTNIKYLINPGSVGQPRDFDFRASAVIFDMEKSNLKIVRVGYDIKTAQQKIINAGLPMILAERLSRGS